MIAEYITIEWNTKKSSSLNVGAIDLQARATVIPYEATVVARNAEVCQLNGMTQADSFDLSVAFADGQSYMLKFWQQSTNLGTIKSLAEMAGKMIKDGAMNAVQDTMLPKLLDASGQPAGGLKYIPVSQPGLSSYGYYRLDFAGKTLDCYTVGTKGGIYYCLYDQSDTMVATVSKQVKVKNGKPCYTLYLADDTWLQPTVLMTAFMDHQSNEDDQHLGTKGYKLNTFQKGLLDRYRPDFIEQVKAQEDPANLPENMPLVQQKVSASQNTLQLIIKRISVIVFIIFFVGIIICFFVL